MTYQPAYSTCKNKITERVVDAVELLIQQEAEIELVRGGASCPLCQCNRSVVKCELQLWQQGVVGGYFGGRTEAAGHDVVFIARGTHRDAIR